jgi:hypothetical protein
MKRLLTSCSAATPHAARSGESRTRLHLEGLEERVVMDWGGTGGVGPPPMTQIVLHRTEDGDVVDIKLFNGMYRVTGFVDGWGTEYDHTSGSVDYPTTITRFVFYLHGGPVVRPLQNGGIHSHSLNRLMSPSSPRGRRLRTEPAVVKFPSLALPRGHLLLRERHSAA